MFKKFIFPMTIASAIAFTACAGSKKDNAEPQQAMSEGETAIDTTAIDTTPADSVVAIKSVAVSCTIDEETENSFQVSIGKKDSVLETTKIMHKDNLFGIYTTIKFKANVSDEFFQNECENAKSYERANHQVSCQNRTIYISKEKEGEDREIALLLPLFAKEVKESCLTIQETGRLPNEQDSQGEDKKENKQATIPPKTENAESSFICNMDMNSNVWTLTNPDSKTTLIFNFVGNNVKVTTIVVTETESPEMCNWMAAMAKEEENYTITCDGKTSRTVVTTIDEDVDKEELYNGLKPSCKE